MQRTTQINIVASSWTSLVWEMMQYEESTAGVYLMEIISLEFIWAWAKCWNCLREMAELRANSWYGENLSSWERGANIQTWWGPDLRMLLLLNIQHFHTMSCQHNNCYRIPNLIPSPERMDASQFYSLKFLNLFHSSGPIVVRFCKIVPTLWSKFCVVVFWICTLQ